MSGSESSANLADETMFARADWLVTQKNSQGAMRHPCEVHPISGVALAAPLKPKDSKNTDNSILRGLIAQSGTDQKMLLIDALGVFAAHHERDGFVKFDSISDLQAANLYIGLLRRMGFQTREFELLSGDPEHDSEYRRAWRNDLSETYLNIRESPPGTNYRPKTSLWGRPSRAALAKRNTGPASFRFTMAMAFIVYGVITMEPPK